CRGLRSVASSRQPLGVAGEVCWRVPSLPVPPPEVDGRGYAAVQLFVERAQGARPGFAVTSRNAPGVAEICRRLDGIPLAIELAAARIRVLSVEQVAQRLDDRFRLLTGGGPSALPRQQTLRATLEWSYGLLPEPERTLFRRLAIFVGSFNVDAVEAIGADRGTGDVLDLLTGLVDKSL